VKITNIQQSPTVSGISVVIPNYNGLALLQEILPAVYCAVDRTGLPFEIIVSDDCSSDNSILFLKEKHPDIVVLESEVNQGFSPTINKGIFKARYSHLLLLNSDVKLHPDYLVRLLRYFDKPDTFGVVGKVIGWDSDEILDGGKFPSFHGFKIKTAGNYLPVKKDPEQWLYSMYLAGSNAFLDREKVVFLGGYNELFAPFYVEDYDLSLKAWRIGWKCYYDDNAVCRHKVSVSIRQSHRKKSIKVVYDRNKMFLHAIHLNFFRRLQWFVQFIFESFIHLFMLRFTWLKSLRLFILNYNRVVESRRSFFRKTNGRDVLTVNQVIHMVRTSLEQNEVTRF
jgi:GT2 family glycosyltransferase